MEWVRRKRDVKGKYVHIWICARHVRRVDAGVNETVVPVLQGRNVLFENLFDVVREFYTLDLHADGGIST